MEECISLMGETLESLERGRAGMPLRSGFRLPGIRGEMGIMPGYILDQEIMGVKAISVFPGNAETEFDAHQGCVVLFDIKYGCTLAIIDATSITSIRTAAVSGLATKLLARKDSHVLAILGSGVQAMHHISSMLQVRPIKQIRVCSLYLEEARQFAERESKRHEIQIDAMPTPHDAIQGADIICTVTSASQPILFGKSISKGIHINAVGASKPRAREIDNETIVKSKFFVDRRESTENEAACFIEAKKAGLIDDSHIRGEIGEILTGSIKGRESDSEITLFKSLGLAVEDIATANFIYKKAIERNVGTYIELGGVRQH